MIRTKEMGNGADKIHSRGILCKNVADELEEMRENEPGLRFGAWEKEEFAHKLGHIVGVNATQMSTWDDETLYQIVRLVNSLQDGDANEFELGR